MDPQGMLHDFRAAGVVILVLFAISKFQAILRIWAPYVKPTHARHDWCTVLRFLADDP